MMATMLKGIIFEKYLLTRYFAGREILPAVSLMTLQWLIRCTSNSPNSLIRV